MIKDACASYVSVVLCGSVFFVDQLEVVGVGPVDD